MKALVTGASSGIGRDISIYLSSLGYDLIIVSRDKSKLEETKKLIKTNCKIMSMDLSNISDVSELVKVCIKEDIDIFVNNAGFGIFGEYSNVDVNKEMNMIDLNIKAVHILTKEVLKYFEKKDNGYILNVASSAAFMPGGPLLSGYYATKSYVKSYTLSLYEELRHKKSNVHISILCPGPVNTNFNNVAGTKFNISSLESEYVAKYAINKMFKNKLVIVPGFTIKLGCFFRRFVSDKMLLKITYKIQKRKE